MSLKKISRIVFLEAPVELYLFWLSWFAFGWAVLLSTNEQIFEASRSYYVLRDISTNPSVWLLVYGGCAMFTFYSLFLKNKKMLSVASMLMLLLWTFTAIALFIPSGVFNTGQFVYGTFAVVAGWCYLRVANHSFNHV